jgi:chaperone modulatory protein CbpM
MDEREAAVVTRVSVERITRWTATGWVRPARAEGRWVFTERDVARVELVRHLVEELELDEEQVPPVLSLIDQLHGVRSCLGELLAALEAEPEEVRARVRARLAAERGG